MSLIDIPAEIELRDQLAVREQLVEMNREFQRRIQWYQRQHWAFWANYDISPDRQLEIRGTSGLAWLLRVRAERSYIEALAALQGKTLLDVLGEPFTNPPRAFVAVLDENNNPTGVITLTPPEEGYDAWGRLINPPASPEGEEP